MALFMFTSGFSSYRKEIGWDVIKRRFLQLMIPFTAWSMILCVIKGDIHIEKMFLYPTQSMWFLFALFFIIAIHVTTCKASKLVGIKEEWGVLIIAISLWILQRITKSKVFATDLISYHFVFYSLGFYCRKYFDRFSQIKPLYISLMALGFLVMAYFRDVRYLQIIHLPSSSYILYEFICSFLAIGAIVPLFYRLYDKLLIMSRVGGVH